VNKKKQKNFYSLEHLALTEVNPTEIRSFLLLFFKKEALSCVSKQFLTSLKASPKQRRNHSRRRRCLPRHAQHAYGAERRQRLKPSLLINTPPKKTRAINPLVPGRDLEYIRLCYPRGSSGATGRANPLQRSLK
jgi:hypothetical protein